MLDETLSLSAEKTEDTLDIAEKIGNSLSGGEVIELIGDLGAGKTTFVRGLAKAAGAEGVSSPSFTLNNRYEADELTISHYDFYRLTNSGIMAEEITEDIMDPKVVTVIEWGGAVEEVLPVERLKVLISPTKSGGRSIIITMPKKLKYLLKEIA